MRVRRALVSLPSSYEKTREPELSANRQQRGITANYILVAHICSCFSEAFQRKFLRQIHICTAHLIRSCIRFAFENYHFFTLRKARRKLRHQKHSELVNFALHIGLTSRYNQQDCQSCRLRRHVSLYMHSPISKFISRWNTSGTSVAANPDLTARRENELYAI